MVVEATRKGFAAFLRQSRLEKGWSLIELGTVTGIAPSYINRLEKRERKNPSVTIVCALAKAFGIEVIDLIELVLKDHLKEGEV